MDLKKIALFLFAAVLLIIVLSACGGKKYPVDYGSAKDAFKHAKDSYRAGTKVTLYFYLVATDTDYRFWLDGNEPLSVTYDEKKGFVLSFTMPERPVKVDYSAVNSMYAEPDPPNMNE